MYKGRRPSFDKPTREQSALKSNGWVSGDSPAAAATPQTSKPAGQSTADAPPASLTVRPTSRNVPLRALPFTQESRDFLKEYLRDRNMLGKGSNPSAASTPPSAAAAASVASKDNEASVISPRRPPKHRQAPPRENPSQKALPLQSPAAALPMAATDKPQAKQPAVTPLSVRILPGHPDEASPASVVLQEPRPAQHAAQSLSMYPFTERQAPQAHKPPQQSAAPSQAHTPLLQRVAAQRQASTSPQRVAEPSQAHTPPQQVAVPSQALTPPQQVAAPSQAHTPPQQVAATSQPAQLSAHVDNARILTAELSLTHVPGQDAQRVSFSLQSSGNDHLAAAPQADLQIENQRLKTMFEQIQSTLQRLDARLEEVQPYTPKQQEQLKTISTHNKLRLFFTQLLANLNSNVSACLSLTSERIGYSSETNDAVSGASGFASAVPVVGSLVSGSVNAGALLRMRHKSKTFGEIGQNYFFSISSMEIANTIFAIELTMRHINHLQHMMPKGISDFAEFICEKVLLPAWKGKKLPAGQLHLLPAQRALMIKGWLEYVYSREAPSMRIKHTDIELGKGLPYEWTAEEILWCSQVQIAGKTYGNVSRNAKFLTRVGDPAEIAALKLIEVSSSAPASQQSPVHRQEYESKSNAPATQAAAQTAAQPVRARSQSCSPAPQSQHPATLFSQRSATPTSHSRSGSGSSSRSYTAAEVTQLTSEAGKKPARPKRHSRASSRLFTAEETAQVKAEGRLVQTAAATAEKPSARNHNAQPRLFTPAKSIHFAGATHHRRTSSTTYDSPTYSSQSRQVVS